MAELNVCNRVCGPDKSLKNVLSGPLTGEVGFGAFRPAQAECAFFPGF